MAKKAVEKAEFDVTKHEMVPKHEILSEKAVEKVLKKYRVKAHQMPRIKIIDPVVKAIGAEVGNVLKITRPSQTAGEAITYRYVVTEQGK